jgi:hypothetical protein
MDSISFFTGIAVGVILMYLYKLILLDILEIK